MLEKKPNIVAYDGFEPSGRMHIAQARALRGWEGRTVLAASEARRSANASLYGRPVCCGASHVAPSSLPCSGPQGVLKALNVNKLTKCGVTFKFW